MEEAGIEDDSEGPLFRPLTLDGQSLLRRHLDRKTPWRLVKKYCLAAGIEPGGWADVASASIRYARPQLTTRSATGPKMHEVREFAGHSDIRTTELYFIRKEEDGEMARGVSRYAHREGRTMVTNSVQKKVTFSVKDDRFECHPTTLADEIDNVLCLLLTGRHTFM